MTTDPNSNSRFSAAEKLKLIRGLLDPEIFNRSVRPMLYRKANNDPERVHELITENLSDNQTGMRILSILFKHPSKLIIKINNTDLIPFGAAAGMDKNGDAINALSHFFGFLEPGTVVLNPRAGNNRPRVAVDETNLDIYNAQGFPSKGLEYFKNNIINYRKSGGKTPIYVSICGLPISEENAVQVAIDEMKTLLTSLKDYVDGFVWNPASPNTAALALLRQPELFEQTASIMKQIAPDKLRLVKLWPYENADKDTLLKFVGSFIQGGGNGVITTNTKMFTKDQLALKDWGYPSAGRSGKFLQSYRLRSIKDIRKSFPEIVIVATGGIYNGDDAYLSFKMGADMLEGYTPYTFYGIGLLRQIERDILTKLRADGYDSLWQMQADIKQRAASA